MGGLFGGGKAPQSQKQQPAGALNIQTSAYGAAKPLCYGKNRVPINLIHYFDFTPIPHTQKQQSGGKGGPKPQSQTTYTYTVAFCGAFAVGGIAGVGTIWKNKEKHTLTSLGLTLFTGGAGQTTWPTLTSRRPSEAIPYANTAYIAHAAFDLGDQTTLPNINIEYKGLCCFAPGTNDDALASDIVVDYLTNARHGAGFTALADLDAGGNSFRKYCLARGLFLSPFENNQRSAGAFLKDIAEICNSAIVYRGGKLNFIPFGDTTITGNGATYTPNLTPVYDLTVDDFLYEQGQPPVKHSAKNPAEAYNHHRIEYNARSNDYNPLIVEAKDMADIDENGLVTKAVTKYTAITLDSVARDVLQLQQQRDLHVTNTYAFRVGVRHSLLEPMDYVTITEPGLGLDHQLVRIIEAIEQDDALDIVAEEVNVGVAHSPLFNTQGPLGYNQDYNADPGSIDPPTIMNAPGLLTDTGYETWIAVSGSDLSLWAGCNVWVSDDNIEYKHAGEILAPARHGVLSATFPAGTANFDTTSTLGVQLYHGKILSGTDTTRDEWRTLLYVDGEWVSYKTAALVSGSTYNLTSLRRAGYGSVRASHPAGDRVVVIDEAIFRLPYDAGNVGKTIYLKFTSFNVWGGGHQDLSAVTAYTHVLGASDVTAPMMGGDSTLTSLQNQITAAQADATASLAKLTDISADNVLTPVEKKFVITDHANVTGEQSTIDSQAILYGLSADATKTAYDTAITDLTTYLATLTSPVLWNNMTDKTTIVRTTFRSKWTAVYSTRTALLQKMYDVARVNTATAQGDADAANFLASVSYKPLKIFDFKGATAPSGITVSGATLTSQNSGTTTRLTASASDPNLTFNIGKTPDQCYLICARVKLVSGTWDGRAYFNNGTHTYSESYKLTLGAPKVGKWTILVWDMRDLTVGGTDFMDSANIVSARLDFLTASGDIVDVDWIQYGIMTPISQEELDTLQTQATAAQADATSALNQLVDISDDGKLTPGEKPTVIRDRDSITAEQAGIDAQADAFGIVPEKATYDSAVTALTTYLATLTSPVLWSNLTGNTTIVGTTFRQKFLDVYSARQVLLNTIYNAAQNLAVGKYVPVGDNLLPNPTFTLNDGLEPEGVNTAYNANPLLARICDGWVVTYDGSRTAGQTGTTAQILHWASQPDGITLAVNKPISLAVNAIVAAQIRAEKAIPVKAGATYLVALPEIVQAWNGSGAVTMQTRITVQWLNSAGTQISAVTKTLSRGTATSFAEVPVTAPAGAYKCWFFIDTFVQNTSGSVWTHDSTTCIRTTVKSAYMIRKMELTSELPMLMYGNGRAQVPTVITYTSAAGTPATATINVAAFSLISGTRTVAYNAMSVGVSHAAGTVTYYLYCDDPDASGGSNTLVATTNGTTLYQSEGRLYLGEVAVVFPASGTGGGSGGRDPGCVTIDMYLNEDLLAVEARDGLRIDCMDIPNRGLEEFKQRIQGVRFTDEECVMITTEGGARLSLSVTTPFDLLDGRTALAPEMLGEYVPTDKGIERVVSVEPIGVQPVARISVGGISYAAGEDPHYRIYSHNALKP